MRIKAVIFDMDGVLLDSMPYHVRAWKTAFKPLGLDICADEIYAREGESWRRSTRDFLIMAGYKPQHRLIERIFKKRSRVFRQIFKPRVFKGVDSLLQLLHKKSLKLGLVTATPRRDVDRMLPEKIMELFDIIVCGGDTKRGKPHPEPYLEALKRLGVKAPETIVIENAPYGIRSAKMAGIRCIAISTSLPEKYLQEADMIADSLKQVSNYFKRRRKR